MRRSQERHSSTRPASACTRITRSHSARLRSLSDKALSSRATCRACSSAGCGCANGSGPGASAIARKTVTARSGAGGRGARGSHSSARPAHTNAIGMDVCSMTRPSSRK
eukprot:scaffold7027_cov106-Isochrysis_galbana.AAC.2